jgi:hypothetical protein
VLLLSAIFLLSLVKPVSAQTLSGQDQRPRANTFRVTAQIAEAGTYELQKSSGSFAATNWLAVTNFNSLPRIFAYEEPYGGSRVRFFRMKRFTDPPVLTKQPAGATNYSGTQVTLASGATGSWPLQMQWYKNGAVVPGATNASLSFSAATSLSGIYNFQASNLWGVVISSNAVVLITNPVATNISGKTIHFVITGASGDFPTSGNFDMLFDPRGSFSTQASSVFLNDRGYWQYGIANGSTSQIYMSSSFIYPGGTITMTFQTGTNGTYVLVAPGYSGGEVGTFVFP